MLKSELLGPILSTSGAKTRKCENRISWDRFCRLLEPRPENAEIGSRGTHFVDFWSQGQKMLNSDPLGPILRNSGAESRKSWNQPSGIYFVDFWSQGQKMLQSGILNPFCRLSEPMTEKVKIGFPGIHFVDFWSPDQKMLKSDFLGSILSTPGTNARKCPRASLPIVVVGPSVPFDSAHCPNIPSNSAHDRCWVQPLFQFCPLSLSA
jgi:hypothetical protein